MTRLVLASANPHKLDELREALPGWEIVALQRDDYPQETGTTYEENAAAKARFGRAHAPPEAWVVGEDSGIEATGLGGRPGVESARWADDGVARMREALAGVPERRARYVCAMVAAGPGGKELSRAGDARRVDPGRPAAR